MFLNRLALAAVLASAACGPQAGPAADAGTDLAAIAAVRHAEAAAVVTGDTMMTYATDDVVIMAPGVPMIVGVGAARSWRAGTRARMNIHLLTYDEPRVTLAGDWAIERYTGLLLASPADGGPMGTSAMKGVHVYRREPDGSWKLAVDVWNGDVP